MKRKIKKSLAGVLAAVMVLSVGTTGTFAAGPRCSKNIVCTRSVCSNTGKSCSFVDKDKDGICDNCGRKNSSKKGCKKYYVDKNGDGVCDNRETRQGAGNGTRRCSGRRK